MVLTASMRTDQVIVEKFVKKEYRNWPRDIKVALSLIKIFPEHQFWEWVEPFETAKSLHFLLTEKCIKTLKEKYSYFLQQQDLKNSSEKLKESFESKPSTPYNHGAEKFGEDVSITRKPKTLREFLNYGKTSEESN